MRAHGKHTCIGIGDHKAVAQPHKGHHAEKADWCAVARCENQERDRAANRIGHTAPKHHVVDAKTHRIAACEKVARKVSNRGRAKEEPKRGRRHAKYDLSHKRRTAEIGKESA